MCSGSTARRCRDSPVPEPSARAAPVDDVGTPRATYRRQCRKESGARSIVEAKEEVDEQRALHSRKARRAERKADGEEVEDRKPVLGVDEPRARAGHVAVLRIAAQSPRARDADAPRPLAARCVPLDTQGDRAVLRRA